MRVRDGYRPKVKFSIALTPDVFRKLNDYCARQGLHRSVFIEDAVRRSLEGKLSGVLTEAPKTVRDIAAKHAPKPKTKEVPKARKPTRRVPS